MPKLTDAAIRAATYDGAVLKLRDGFGLYAHVLPSGKYFRFDYRFAGKRKTLTIGAYPAVSLKKARIELYAAKALLADGIDPSYQKQLRKHVGDDHSFGAVTVEWMRVQDWSDGHRRTIRQRLDKDVLPKLGTKDVRRIGPLDVLGVLRAIESRGAVETAHRAKVVIGQVMRYAIAIGMAESDPTRDLRGVLKVSRSKPRPAIVDPVEFGKLLRALDTYDQSIIVAHALRLSPYVALRPVELREARWDEIDGSTWTIPAVRMKGKRAEKKEHVVHLAPSALAIVDSIREYTGSGELIFPSVRSKGRSISDGTLNAALRYLGYSGEVHTSHSYRSTFSTMSFESGLWREDVIEAQLAHVIPNRVQGAYNRAQHLDARRELMIWWGERVDTMRRSAAAR